MLYYECIIHAFLIYILESFYYFRFKKPLSDTQTTTPLYLMLIILLIGHRHVGVTSYAQLGIWKTGLCGHGSKVNYYQTRIGTPGLSLEFCAFPVEPNLAPNSSIAPSGTLEFGLFFISKTK